MVAAHEELSFSKITLTDFLFPLLLGLVYSRNQLVCGFFLDIGDPKFCPSKAGSMAMAIPASHLSTSYKHEQISNQPTCVSSQIQHKY
jgi:hypothetical protein